MAGRITTGAAGMWLLANFLPPGDTRGFPGFSHQPGVTQTLPRHIALSEGCFISLGRFAAFLLQILKY